MAYELRDFSDVAAETTLSADITSTDTSFTVASGTGYPTGGASGNFMMQLGSELIKCSARSGNSFTVAGGVAGRGQNSTSASAHVAGVTVNHVHTAINDSKEANYAVSKTVGKVTTSQDLLVADAANSFTRLGVGSSGQVLLVSAGNVAWGAVPSPGANSIGASQITDGTVGAAELGSDAVTTVKIQDGAVTAAKLAANATKNSIAFAKTGALTTGTGVIRWPAPFTLTVVNTRLAINTAPTGTTSTPISGASVVVDVNKNGTTIYTTQGNRPNVQSGAFASATHATPDTTGLVAGDYLTVDVDFKGSTIAGSDLTIVVYYTV